MFNPTSCVETLGSWWYFDDEAKLYVRAPKSEGPRPRGPNGEDWGGVHAEPGLQDNVRHSFTSWKTTDNETCPYSVRGCEHCPHLLIEGEDFLGPRLIGPRVIIHLDSRVSA